jgi:hypothetical protein
VDSILEGINDIKEEYESEEERKNEFVSEIFDFISSEPIKSTVSQSKLLNEARRTK